MPRYIDADALMKEFRDFVRDSNNSDFAPVPNWNDAVSLVGSAPTADVVERKVGKWVNRWSGDGSVWLEEICSECGLTFEDEPHGYNYCPNCGAEMEGDEDDR